MKVLLASKSPRRKKILEDAGFEVEVIVADVDETYPENLAENEIASFLAKKKAEPFIHTDLSDSVLLTADSIVVLNGIVYGKPESKQHAFDILQALSGNVHAVYTGVHIMDNIKTETITEKSEIKFAELSPDDINFYIDHYQPFDKAGAYGIQDWIGLCRVEWIKGTFSNIMGLPMASIYPILKNWKK